MSFRFAIPSELRGAVDAATADWQANRKIDRFWKKDPSLWTSDGEEKWMGWIDIVERQQKDLSALAELGGDVRSADFKSVLLLGMGGSSLCPEVLAKTFGPQLDFPELYIVDSTDPAQVMAACDEVNLSEALVIVASKSGSTLEPNVLKQYFFEEMKKAVGAERAGSHFLAVSYTHLDVYKRQGEENWLGWIDIVERQQKDLAAFAALAAGVVSPGSRDALIAPSGVQAQNLGQRVCLLYT